MTTRIRRKATLHRVLIATGTIALGFGLFSAAAGAAPFAKPAGIKTQSLAVHQAGYKRFKKKSQVYVDRSGNYYVAPSNNVTANGIPPYSEQSDEIRELRRAFPSTNWPPSMRY
ncbi:MAG: hypothetical protein ACREDO_06505 [Methyloceanibacter sp.]